jgi:hypothetical protein
LNLQGSFHPNRKAHSALEVTRNREAQSHPFQCSILSATCRFKIRPELTASEKARFVVPGLDK